MPKISASFPTTLALPVGSYLLTHARQASNPSPSLLVRTTFSSALCPSLKFHIQLGHSGIISKSCFHCSDDFFCSSTLKPSSPSMEHPGPVSPRNVLAAEALWLISRCKRSKSESPAGPKPTSQRCICSRSRLRSVQSFLQHLTSVPVGFQELSHLFCSFFALPHSFVHFHHLLDQGRNLVLHDFELTTQTQTSQESTTRSSAPDLSGTPNFFGHDEFS